MDNERKQNRGANGGTGPRPEDSLPLVESPFDPKPEVLRRMADLFREFQPNHRTKAYIEVVAMTGHGSDRVYVGYLLTLQKGADDRNSTLKVSLVLPVRYTTDNTTPMPPGIDLYRVVLRLATEMLAIHRCGNNRELWDRLQTWWGTPPEYRDLLWEYLQSVYARLVQGFGWEFMRDFLELPVQCGLRLPMPPRETER